MDLFTPEYFMNEALKQAKIALENGEVPIGAVIVSQERIIARAHNQTELLNDVTAHAEILAITSASSYLGAKYLNECELYVTLEPCSMCAGALKWSQIGKIAYGAIDEKAGFMTFGKEMLHPKTKIEYGILETECKVLLQDFFKSKR